MSVAFHQELFFSPELPLEFGQETHAERSLPDDKFAHYRFTEATDPELARTAWIMHADGYHEAGFIEASAIGPDGLSPEMDKARGPNVDYYVSFHREPGKQKKGATWRIESIPPGGTYKDLPAYGVTEKVLSPEGAAYLEFVAEHYDLKEIGAMARTSADPMALFEIIRHGMRDVYGKNQAWLFSIVENTLTKGLTPRFGENNFAVLGEAAQLDDDKVKGDKVRLIPAILFPDLMIENIYASIQAVPTGVARKRLMDNMRFLTQGLDPDQVSRYVTAELQRDALSRAAAKATIQQPVAAGVA